MTQDEIIDMAKQAGLLDMDFEAGDWEIHEFTVFAKLVAAKAVEREREACAKVCENLPAALEEFDALGRAADAIRARGEA